MSHKNVLRQRLPAIELDDMSPEQIAAVESLVATPRGELRGPFKAMLYSPEFLSRTQSLGAFLRYSSGLPDDLREFAIILTARAWRQGYEWSAHALLAEKAGVGKDVIDAVAAGKLPKGMTPGQDIIYRFCNELHRNQSVSDRAYEDAVSLLEQVGVVDLCGICGYYTMLAMLMNVARTPLPPGTDLPFAPPPDATPQ
jgi:4-carboxymuconolactone decarboxylase